MASLCCPIEMEPRTLNHGQLNHAREVAADVVQMMEPDKAQTVFIKDMRPIVSLEEASQCKENIEQANMSVDCSSRMPTNKTPCQCACESTILDSPDEDKLKEPSSAPF